MEGVDAINLNKLFMSCNQGGRVGSTAGVMILYLVHFEIDIWRSYIW